MSTNNLILKMTTETPKSTKLNYLKIKIYREAGASGLMERKIS